MSEDDLWERTVEDQEDEEEREGARWENPVFDDELESDGIPQELLVSLDAQEDEAEADLEQGYHYDTQRGDGHTYDVSLALDQGLTYTPPSDPPVMPSAGDREGVEVAAGFGLSMEDSNPNAEVLPEWIDGNDLDLEDDVHTAIRFNSETQHLTDVRVRAGNGIVALFGTVPDDDDLERLIDIVRDLEGVHMVLNHLTTDDEEGGVEE